MIGSSLYEPDLKTYSDEGATKSLTYRNIYNPDNSIKVTRYEDKWEGEKFINGTRSLWAFGRTWQQFFIQLTILGLSKGERCQFERLDELLKKTKEGQPHKSANCLVCSRIQLNSMDKIINKIKKKIGNHIAAEKAYIKKLVFPLKLFPIKLFIYFIYYPIKIAFKLLLAILSLLWDTISYPFRGLKNFIKAIFISAGVLYMIVSLFVIVDYLSKEYGYIGKFICSFLVDNNL